VIARIDVEDLTVRFGETVALDSLSLSVDGGQIVGLIGRNGAGKSTLLTVLAAFRPATSGEVRVAGEPVFENANLVRNICLIRDKLDFDKDQSVKDVLEFVGSLRPNWDQEFAESLVRKFDLPAKKKVEGFSRGMQSAVGTVVGLASRAPLTMFDETYLGMDAPSRYIFYDALLQDYMEHPRTIVLSTHLIQEVENLFEDIIIIDRGKLLLHEKADTLRNRGVSAVGPASAVDQFTSEMTVLSERRLGGTKSSTVLGDLNDERRKQAKALGLELEPVSIQDLFVHLTGQGVESE